jgi:hypothetical protein
VFWNRETFADAWSWRERNPTGAQEFHAATLKAMAPAGDLAPPDLEENILAP